MAATPNQETTMLFITFYQVAGSRCDGTYIVNASSKREANSIVKAVDPDYVKVKSMSQKEFEDDGGEWDCMVEGVTLPEPGKCYQLECGS
jgi:hypothetical protein